MVRIPPEIWLPSESPDKVAGDNLHQIRPFDQGQVNVEFAFIATAGHPAVHANRGAGRGPSRNREQIVVHHAVSNRGEDDLAGATSSDCLWMRWEQVSGVGRSRGGVGVNTGICYRRLRGSWGDWRRSYSWRRSWRGESQWPWVPPSPQEPGSHSSPSQATAKARYGHHSQHDRGGANSGSANSGSDCM